MITTHSRRKRGFGEVLFWKQKFSNHASIAEEVVWAGGEIYGSHMRRKNAAAGEKKNQKPKTKKSRAVFLLFRVCEKGSNTLQPPESPFGLDQFILNEVFIRAIFIRPGLYYKGNIRLRVNPANVFPIDSEPTHVFHCKIKIMLFFFFKAVLPN